MRLIKHLAALLVAALMIFGTVAAASADTYLTLNGFTFYSNADHEAVIVGYDDHDPCVAIPDTLLNARVAEIAANAFFNDDNIREVSFENASGLRRIGSNAFCGCTGLTSVSLPYLEELGFGAFQSCTQLSVVTVAGGLTTIPAQAFYCCESLSEVILPDSVTTIGAYAFGGCAALTSLTVSDSVTDIADNAFDGCDALVLACSRDSYAHRYAVQNNIPYILSADSAILGDADGDGSVTIVDATCIQRVLAGYPVSSFVREAADIDGDGLNIMDATKIQRYLVGYEVAYPIGEPVSI
jgi:hypothetical protein